MRFFENEYLLRIGESFGIRWYGFLIACGVVLALYLALREFKRHNYKVDDVFDLVFMCIVVGFIGARLYYVVWKWEEYASNPISSLYIWQGGLAIYGGVIGGVLAIYAFCKWKKKYKFTTILDIAAPSVVIAQAIGRWGNFFNNEAFGMPVTNKALQFFPYAVKIPFENRPDGMLKYEWFQATFFYESMACLLIFIFLMWYRKRQKFNGEILLYYTLLYGIERSIVEGFRTDSLYLFNSGIRVSQALSMVLVVASAALLIYNYVKKNRNFVLASGAIDPAAVQNSSEKQTDTDEPKE